MLASNVHAFNVTSTGGQNLFVRHGQRVKIRGADEQNENQHAGTIKEPPEDGKNYFQKSVDENFALG